MFKYETVCEHCDEVFGSSQPNVKQPLCKMCQDYINECESYEAEVDQTDFTDEDYGYIYE